VGTKNRRSNPIGSASARARQLVADPTIRAGKFSIKTPTLPARVGPSRRAMVAGAKYNPRTARLVGAAGAARPLIWIYLSFQWQLAEDLSAYRAQLVSQPTAAGPTSLVPSRKSGSGRVTQKREREYPPDDLYTSPTPSERIWRRPSEQLED
jgi:hypothetical protein